MVNNSRKIYRLDNMDGSRKRIFDVLGDSDTITLRVKYLLL